MSKDNVRDWLIENSSDAQNFFDGRLRLLFDSQPKYKEFVDLYGKLNQLERYALLVAHGDSNGKWKYYDGKRGLNVQSWINKHDGQYSGLLLCVCNPENDTPTIRKSALLIADRDIHESRGAIDNPVYNLLVPDIGEIDGYTIDHEIEQLRGKLQGGICEDKSLELDYETRLAEYLERRRRRKLRE